MKTMIMLIIALVALTACEQAVNDTPPTVTPDIVTQPMPVPTESGNVEETIVEQSPDTGISLSELATHDIEDDCWIGYEGKAYDVTEFLPKHPGGVKAIARWCGTYDNFMTAFVGKHGLSKVSMLEREGMYEGDIV